MKIVVNAFLGFILFWACSACNRSVNAKAPSADTISVKTIEPAHIDTKVKKLNEVAKFIAGMPIDSTSELYKYTILPEWQMYAKEANLAWDKFKRVADYGKSWREKEIPAASDTCKTLFYPFGGPDFLFANIFFPKAQKYIMIGLEDPGSSPQATSFNKNDLKDVLSLYKVAIEDVIHLSFFRTNDMKVELKTNAIDGTAPIIMLFLARSGKKILDVQPMELNSEGKLVPTDSARHTAIEIKFTNPDDTITRYVHYLSTNLADPSLKANKPFMSYLENIDEHSVSFVKSATYLMHKTYFSVIRNTVLKKSMLILQDDSGIAYKFFDKKLWNISLFGTYEKPIDLFKDFYEPDLYEAYKKNSKPLDIRIGYNSKSHLLLAQKFTN